jgi:hypothetical protein
VYSVTRGFPYTNCVLLCLESSTYSSFQATDSAVGSNSRDSFSIAEGGCVAVADNEAAGG